MAQSGVQMKLAGLKNAAQKHGPDLRLAQAIAEFIAGFMSSVTADDVREHFEIREGRELNIGNAMGMLFANKKKWQCVGRVKSKRPSSHTRYVSQWKLREAYKPAPQPFEVGIENGVRFCIRCGEETEKCTCVGHQ